MTFLSFTVFKPNGLKFSSVFGEVPRAEGGRGEVNLPQSFGWSNTPDQGSADFGMILG